MKCTDIVKENKRLKVENEVLKQKVKILKDAVSGALVSIGEIIEEPKGCDSCSKKPKEGENYSDECGVCRYFYGDSWERKND